MSEGPCPKCGGAYSCSCKNATVVDHNHSYGYGTCPHPDCVKASSPKPLEWVVKHTKAWIVDCRTGCSCCNYENHDRGPFANNADADKAVKIFREKKITSSQYSETGQYEVECWDAEVLPDGRIIVDDHVFPGFVRVEDCLDDDKARISR